MKDLTSLSTLIETLQEIPAIGKKSATRIAFHLANNKFKALKLINSLEEILNIKECEFCNNLTEHQICSVCSDENRDKIVAIVESQKDILILEENKIFKGYYFVLKKLDSENIEKLKEFIKQKEIQEVIFSFTPSLENEAKILLLEDKLKELNIEFSQIAQGVPTGVTFENIDINSLQKAISKRTKLS